MAARSELDDEKLRKTKSEIHSLLVSSPSKSVLLNQFLKEFQKTIGKPLPFKEFNYHSPLQFLHFLTDIVQVVDASDGARLIPVTNELSSHISELVDHQKKSVNKRPAYRNITYHSPSYKAKSPLPPHRKSYEGQPLMTCYTRPQPVFCSSPMPGMNPYAPMFISHPAELRQRVMCSPFDSAGPPSDFNYPVGNQQSPSAHPSSVPYAALRGHFAPPTGSANLKNPTEDNSNGFDVDGFMDNESENEASEVYVTFKPEIIANVANETNGDAIVDHRSVIEDSSCMVPNIDNNQPDSTTMDENVVDRASVDVQPSGQENQDLPSSPGSLSETSKCSDKNDLVNNDVKNKIWALLEEHSNGVPSSTFLGLYKSLHSCSLNLAAIGYSSLKEMVLKNEDVFSFEKNKGSDDWILYDARLRPKRRQSLAVNNKWIPHTCIDNLAALARKYKDGIDADEILHCYKKEYSTEINPEMLGFDSLYSFLENCKSITFRRYGERGMVYPKDWVFKSETTTAINIKEPALPPPEEMKFLWKEYFKEYECDPTFRFKPPVIPDDKVLQVKIADLHSPALMWIQFVDDMRSLSDMMYLMNLHYDSHHEEYTLAENVVLPGLAVASMFSGKWHRATVLSMKGEYAEVLYVDYGTTCRSYKSELRKLDKMFGHNRVYAIKASLFCLVPYEGDEWSIESCDFLYTQYADKIVYAEVCSINYQEPSVEVILFETSKWTEININDLLASKNLARYMMNPASVMNERTVSRLYKFLPRWFSTSEKVDSDVIQCCKNLMLCTSAESIPMNSDVVPCCKLHCIQALCQANSEAMAVVWDWAARQEEERIVNNVLTQLEDCLKVWGWESCLTSALCCVDGESQANPTEISHHQVHSVRRQHSHSQQDPQPPKNLFSSNKNLSSESTSLSDRFWASGNRNIVKKQNEPGLKTRPRLLKSRVIRYINARFNSGFLTLIFLNGEIRVCLSQLFQLTKLPSMLAKKRLELASLNVEFMHVSRTHSVELYNDLQTLKLVLPEGDPVLVSLSDAPQIIRAVDPLSSYRDAFASLAKEVAPIIDELCEPSADCK